ncbi:hypothetical protein EIP86_001391 [Pleurotus ostreatoroseus]|nr:hypothetical protein EIP86_001391 [Pleurotus ostreatoroseus]
MRCDPGSAFRHFPAVVSAILEASSVKCRLPRESAVFRNNPTYVEESCDRREGSLPNTYFLLAQDVVWSNVIASGEYRKKNEEADRHDNIVKVTKSMAECMYRDPRRRFTFGYTIENTSMRLWYCDRLQIVASETFNFVTDHAPITHFFFSLAYAGLDQLGWDVTMDPRGDGLNFDIRVDGFDGTQRVYRTLELLTCPKLDHIKGKEGYTLDEIHALPLNTETHTQKDLSGAFPTSLCHGYVYSDQDRRRLDFVPSFTASGDDSTFVETPPNVSLWTSPAGAQSSIEEPDVSHRRLRVHYRIVFKEVGKPLSHEQSLPVIYKMLAQTAYALHHLHQAGWVHRDISPGNILIVAGRATLMDLEYARREGQGREYRMGTPGFMAVEVQDQKYLLQWAAKKRRPRPTEDKPMSEKELHRRLQPSEDNPLRPRSPVVLPQAPRPPVFRYNALHDLESLWWIAIYFVVKYHVVDKTQDPPGIDDIAALAEQCKWAYRLFDGYEDRFYAITIGSSETINDVQDVVHPLVRPVITVLEDLRQDLRVAYVQKEADPEAPGFHPHIHQAFIGKLLDIAFAPLEHVSLLQLPELDAHGKVIIPPELSARSPQERKDEDGAGVVVEEPKNVPQHVPCAQQQVPDTSTSHTQRGKKRSLGKHERTDHTAPGGNPPKRAHASRTDHQPPRAVQRLHVRAHPSYERFLSLFRIIMSTRRIKVLHPPRPHEPTKNLKAPSEE